MTSEKQVLANRRNAQKSSGPRSQQGKQAVRFNALRHGLLAADNLLPDESAEELANLQTALRDELRPEGEMEQLLVERIISAMWRLRRLGRVEAALFTCQQARVEGEFAHRQTLERTGIKWLGMDTGGPRRYVDSPANRELIRQKAQTQEMARQRRDQAEAIMMSKQGILGQAFLKTSGDKDAFSKLSRYESTIERSLYKALHELQRLQAKRQGQAIAPPLAIDVELSTSDAMTETMRGVNAPNDIAEAMEAQAAHIAEALAEDTNQAEETVN
jgi:hypothetical protein